MMNSKPPRFASTLPRVIGLTGLAGVGKDTVAEILRKEREYIPVAFADPLRTEIMDAFSVPIHVLTDRTTKEAPTPLLALSRCMDMDFEACMIDFNKTPLLDMTAPRSPRQIMQWWGTEYRRQQDPHYWTKAMGRRLADIAKAGQRAVVTDVRFMNEARLVRDYHGDIWQVLRRAGVAQTGHSSETSGAEFAPTQTVDNNGDLYQLQRTVLRMVPLEGVTA